MTLYKVHRSNKMTLNISNKVYVVAAITALTALGAYLYTTKSEDIQIESEDEEKIESEDE